MKKRWAILMALASFGAGVAGASWFWREFSATFINYSLVARTQADIVTKEGVLERLRAGKVPEATRDLEELLDGDLIIAGAFAKDGTKFDANTRRAVEREFKARSASGYAPSNKKVRMAVQDAFRMLSSQIDDFAAQPIAPRDAPKVARP